MHKATSRKGGHRARRNTGHQDRVITGRDVVRLREKRRFTAKLWLAR